jgi:hypothetical protein
MVHHSLQIPPICCITRCTYHLYGASLVTYYSFTVYHFVAYTNIYGASLIAYNSFMVHHLVHIPPICCITRWRYQLYGASLVTYYSFTVYHVSHIQTFMVHHLLHITALWCITCCMHLHTYRPPHPSSSMTKCPPPTQWQQ